MAEIKAAYALYLKAAKQPAAPAQAPKAASAAPPGGSGFQSGFLTKKAQPLAAAAAPSTALKSATPTATTTSTTMTTTAAAAAAAAAAARPAEEATPAPLVAAFVRRWAAPPPQAPHPSRLQQRFELGRLCAQYAQRGLQPGDAWCVLPAAWWAAWCAYVGGFSDADDVAPCLRLAKRTGSLSFALSDAGVRAEWPALEAAEAADARAASARADVEAGAPLLLSSSAPTTVMAAAEAGASRRRTRRASSTDGAGLSLEPPGPVDPWPLLDPASVAAAAAAAGPLAPPLPASAPLGGPHLALRADLVPELDFVVHGAEVGAALRLWHGAAGPAVVRFVVPEPAHLLVHRAAGEESSGAAPPKLGPCIVALYPERLVQAATAAAAADDAAGAGGRALVGECSACGQQDAAMRCGTCHEARYCSRECQSSHWHAHRQRCALVAGGGADAQRSAALGDGARNGLRGLVNLGNTCFMNSSLQCLSACEPLTAYFLSGRWESELNASNPLGSGGRLAAAYAALLRGLWHSPRGSGALAPSELKRAVGGFHSAFEGFAQHDAQELLNYALDGLHEDLNRVKVKRPVEDVEADGQPDGVVAREAWERYQSRNRSVVVDTFAGQLKSTLVCPRPGCGKVSVKFDPYLSLSLPLPPPQQRHLSVLVQLQRVLADPHSAARAAAPELPLVDTLLAVLVQPQSASRLDPRGVVAAALAAAEDSPREVAVHAGAPRFEAHGLVLERGDALAPAVLAALSAASGIPRERLLLRGREPGTSCRLVELDAAHTAEETYAALGARRGGRAGRAFDASAGQEPLLLLYAYEAPAEPPAPPAGGEAPPPLVRVWLQHLHPELASGALAGPEPEDLDPLTLPLADVIRQSESDYAPTLVWVRHDATIAQLRLAVARAAVPLVDVEGLRTILHEALGARAPASEPATPTAPPDAGAPAAVLTLVLACVLPVGIASRSDDAGARRAWLPVSTEGSDGLRQPLSLAAARSLERQVELELVLAWRGESLKLLALDRLAVRLAELHTGGIAEWRAGRAQRAAAASAAAAAGVTLAQCFEHFGRTERLDSRNQWYCPRCKDHVAASKTLAVWSTPELLVLHLKRFEARNAYFSSDKVDTLVRFPLRGLDVGGYTGAGGGGGGRLLYDCFGVVNHYGSVHGGHYTAFAAAATSGGGGSERAWHEFDDSHVRPCAPEDVVSEAAYVLFYRRRRAEAAAGALA